MIKKAIIAIIILGAGFWITRSYIIPETESPPPSSSTNIKGFVKEGEVVFVDSTNNILAKIDVEIASQPEERNQGLMYRDQMPEDFGMLFIFENMAPRSFWMRNTPIPLDLIFVNDKNRIVSIQPDTEPYSDESILSGDPAMYVVEVNAGFCDRKNIRVGHLAKF